MIECIAFFIPHSLYFFFFFEPLEACLQLTCGHDRLYATPATYAVLLSDNCKHILMWEIGRVTL